MRTSSPLPDVQRKWGDFVITHLTVDGTLVMLGESESRKLDRSKILPVVDVIKKANGWVADPNFQIKRCAVTSTTSRFAYYEKKPILLLDLDDANAEGAGHEAGHAIFDYYCKSSRAPKGADERVADVFVRLAATKVITDKEARRRRRTTRPVCGWPTRRNGRRATRPSIPGTIPRSSSRACARPG